MDSGIIQLLGDLLVGKRLRGILFLDHFLDQPLQRQQRHVAAFRPVHRFAEERAKLQNALRRVRVFAGYGAAYRGGVHADFLRHFLDHHGLERVRTLIQKFALPRNNGLAHAQNGVLALLDVFHQLHGGGKAFLDVVAHIAVGGILDQQAAIGRT